MSNNCKEWLSKNKLYNEANTVCFNAVRLAWFTLTHKSSYGVGLKQAMAHLTINNSYTEEGFKDTALKVVASTRN